MTLKTILFIVLGIVSFGVSLLVKKNKEESNKTRERMLAKVNQAKNIEKFKNSLDSQHPISTSIVHLLENFEIHDDVGNKLNEEEIKSIENKLQLELPVSYKIFLKYFGDGGSWVFSQYIDSIQNHSYLKNYNKSLGETIQLDKQIIHVDSLLCLMTEDSNGGAWCWLTSEEKKDNEWALAYYIDQKLHYKVENFTEWLNILAKDGYEVIRVLDTEEELGLG
ncbi:SMI1/KNR4 family protein [Polaribacter sp. PL03]|uniref:SMI1/KNR4 family protein n=1 Tax=Polaribacter sp. PL03 TaxID=3088353 RepID=UPI0029CEE44A|nr:SMI1/KNR4 family protein [Polaribacter sp. PL03]MDX6745666.1 SMI1/KNR4 family protein [Polaribacter sp. PL03]